MDRKNFFWLRAHYGDPPAEPAEDLRMLADRIDEALAAPSRRAGAAAPADPRTQFSART